MMKMSVLNGVAVRSEPSGGDKNTNTEGINSHMSLKEQLRQNRFGCFFIDKTCVVCYHINLEDGVL